MKIAIMTQPLGSNYGGIMQAYALQQVLIKNKYDVVTINRKKKVLGATRYYAFIIYRIVMKLFGKRNAPILVERHENIVNENLARFVKNRILITEMISSADGLKQHFKQNAYDAIIVGSDQTWRPKYSPDIYNYFLDFIKDRRVLKIAYGCSFGVDNWEFSEEQTEKCSALAKNFNFISVRESSGVSLCKQYLGVEAQTVLDPTLLLPRSHYEELFSSCDSNFPNNGLATYWLDPSREKFESTDVAASELDLVPYDIQYFDSGSSADGRLSPPHQKVPVERWLRGIYEAKCVLTDSFHGVVFSIIFCKPFIVIINKERGASRFTSLLNQFGLQNRMVDDPKDIPVDLLKAPLDEEFDLRLNSNTEKSLNFLITALKS